MTDHPVATLLRDAAAGRFPAPDGGWHRVPPWRDGVEAVLAFTGHAVLAVGDDVSDERLAGSTRRVGGAHHPRVLTALAGPGGWVDSLDAVLVARGRAGPGCSCRAPTWPTTRRGTRSSPRRRAGARSADRVRWCW